MKLVKEEINKIIYNLFKNKHPLLAELILNWAKIVGIKFAKNCFPFKISSYRNKATRINILYVNTNSSSESMQLLFQQEIILERISVYFGYKAIDKLKFSLSNNFQN